MTRPLVESYRQVLLNSTSCYFWKLCTDIQSLASISLTAPGHTYRTLALICPVYFCALVVTCKQFSFINGIYPPLSFPSGAKNLSLRLFLVRSRLWLKNASRRTAPQQPLPQAFATQDPRRSTKSWKCRRNWIFGRKNSNVMSTFRDFRRPFHTGENIWDTFSCLKTPP